MKKVLRGTAGDLKMVNFRATQEEIEKMNELAKKYCNGKISQWLRYAATKCVPKEEDLVVVKK